MSGDNETDIFGCVQPGCDVCEDVREAHVVLVALAARMTRWAVGGRRSHPLVSLSILQ